MKKASIVRDSLDGSSGFNLDSPPMKAQVENVDGDILDVIYDPVLHCYYDPKKNDYYELKHD